MTLQLNFYNLPILIAGCLNIALVLFVILFRNWNPLHRRFIFWNGVLFIWNLGAFGIWGSVTSNEAMVWCRVVSFGIVFVPAAFLGLVLEVCGFTSSRQRLLLYGLSAFGMILLVCDFIFAGFLTQTVVLRSWGYAPVGGIGSKFLDPAIAMTSIYGLYLLFQETRIAVGTRRDQMRYFFYGSLFAFIGGGINVLAIQGAPIYPVGNILNILYSVMVSYAVVSYRWVHVRMLLRMGAIWLLYVGLFSTFTAFILWSMLPLMKRMVLFLAVLVPILGCSYFYSLWVAHQLKKVLFSRMRDLKEQLNTFLDELQYETNIQHISEQVIERVSKSFGFSGGVLLIPELVGSPKWFVASASTGFKHVQDGMAYELSGPTEHAVYTQELGWWNKNSREANARTHAYESWLLENHATLSVPLRHDNQLVGLWLLQGPAGAFDEVFQLMGEFSKSLAWMLQRAISLRGLAQPPVQVINDGGMEQFGVCAQEIAHEISKPLTHILNEESRLELEVPKKFQARLWRIEKEVKRISDILQGFADLYSHAPLRTQTINLKDYIKEVVESLHLNDHPHLTLTSPAEEVPAIRAHPTLIRQILKNIIQNAYEALPAKDARIQIEFKLTHQSVIEIHVSDNGLGIPSEDQNRIFDSFFTTKRPRGGSGLGLAISRAMVQRHHGEIRIESPLNETGGTRVIITLPMMRGD